MIHSTLNNTVNLATDVAKLSNIHFHVIEENTKLKLKNNNNWNEQKCGT